MGVHHGRLQLRTHAFHTPGETLLRRIDRARPKQRVEQGPAQLPACCLVVSMYQLTRFPSHGRLSVAPIQLEAEYREKVQLYWHDQEDPDVDCSDAITAHNTHRNRYGP